MDPYHPIMCIDPSVLGQIFEDEEEDDPGQHNNVAVLDGVTSAHDIQSKAEAEQQVVLTALASTVATRTSSMVEEAPMALLKRDSATDVVNDDVTPMKQQRMDSDLASLVQPTSTASVTATRVVREDAEFQLCQFMVDNLSEARAKLQKHEQENGVLFRQRRVPKDFGKTDWRSGLSKKKIYWDDCTPFIKAAPDTMVMECHQGKDYDANRRQKRKDATAKKEAAGTSNAPSAGQTKKTGCPAKVQLEERIYFQTYQVKNSPLTKRESFVRSNRTKLRQMFTSNPDQLEGERRIRLLFLGEHDHPTLAQASNKEFPGNKENGGNKLIETLDPSVIDKIHEHCWTGEFNASKILRSLLQQLCSSLRKHPKQPPQGRTAPRRKDVCNHVNLAKIHIQQFRQDQELFAIFAENWRRNHPADLFHFQQHRFAKTAIEKTDSIPGGEFQELDPEGTVFLMNEQNTILALGRKVLDPAYLVRPREQQSSHQLFEVKEVLCSGVKNPHDGSDIPLGATVLWPIQFVLDIGGEKKPQVGNATTAQSLQLLFQLENQKKLLESTSGLCYLDVMCCAERANLIFYLVSAQVKDEAVPVAFIVTQAQNAPEDLEKLLGLLKGKNPGWKPRYFITFSERRLKDILQKVFPEAKTQISDKEREREWADWFALSPLAPNINRSFKKELDLLANAETVKDFDSSLEVVRGTLKKQSGLIMAYWEETWLSRVHDWARLFCSANVIDQSRKPWFLSPRNSLELLSHSDTFRETRRLLSFAEMCRHLISVYIPKMVEDYIQKNENEEEEEKTEMKKSKVLLESLKQAMFTLENHATDSKEKNQLIEETLSKFVPLTKNNRPKY